MVALNKRLVRMISATRGQFIAVTVVLAIGILSYVALHMTVKNLSTTVETYYRQTQMGHIFCDVMRIPEGELASLMTIPGIKSANGRVVSDVKFDTGYKGEKTTLRLVSLPEQADLSAQKPISDVFLISGRKPTSDDEAMIIHHFARARNIKLEDEFDIVVGGKRKTLTVCGIVSNPEYIYLVEDEQSLLPDPRTFGVAYVTEQFAQTHLGFSKSYNNLLFTVQEREQGLVDADLDALVDVLDRKLDKYGVIRLFKRENHISTRIVQEEITQGVKTANTVPLIFLAVAGTIIAVMLGRIVKNDRITIGVFKAMGYTNASIMWHYTKYALGIGVIGSVIGMLIGALSANQLTGLYTSTVYDIPILVGRLYPEYLVLAVILGSTFCVGAGMYGAKGVLNIYPAEAMRPEVPKTGRRIVLERIKPFWHRLTFTWKVVIRNLFRSKRRTAFIVMGIALTFVVTLLPFYMLSAFLSMFDQQYGKMYTMDMQISLSKPMNGQVVAELKGIFGDSVARIEPIAEFPFEISKGWRKKNVNILGLISDTTMYHFTDVQGNPLTLPDKGIALTEGLARLLDVTLGQQISIKSFVPGRGDEILQVSAIVEQPLGVNAYMSLPFMQRTLLDHGFVNGAVVKGNWNYGGEPSVLEASVLDASKLDAVKYVQSTLLISDMMNIFKEFTALTYMSILVMLVSAGVLGFAIVYNATIMSIHERKMEFSSLRVLGFDKGHIFSMLIRENLLMTILGILCGIPIGASLLDSILKSFSNELYTMKADLDPWSFVYSTIITLAFVLVAQLATYRKITKLDFIEALKARIS